MTGWLNPLNYIKTTKPKEESIEGIKGEEGAELFTAFIHGMMSDRELGGHVTKLFPLKELTVCNLESTNFAIQFQKDAQAKIAKVENGGEKQLEGAIFSIPRIIKGTFDPLMRKLTFDAAYAPQVSLLLCDKQVGWGSWSTQVSASTPNMPLYSVQYDNESDKFTLGGISNLSITVPRAVFEATFKNYEFF